jgi:hypothetical protein
VGGQPLVLSGDPGYPELTPFCVVRDGPGARWVGIIRRCCRLMIGGVLSVGVNLRQEDEMYVRDPLRVVVTGPLAAYAAGFCAELERQGYAAQSDWSWRS